MGRGTFGMTELGIAVIIAGILLGIIGIWLNRQRVYLTDLELRLGHIERRLIALENTQSPNVMVGQKASGLSTSA